jgi:hypothetical protein
MNTEIIPMDKLAKAYLKIRTRKSELTQQYEAELADLDEQETQIENAMKDQMLAMGTKSMRTDFGTQDWASFKEFVIQHDAVDLLERRIAQRNMAQFLEENPELVPPGLNSDTHYQISVRKPSK